MPRSAGRVTVAWPSRSSVSFRAKLRPDRDSRSRAACTPAAHTKSRASGHKPRPCIQGLGSAGGPARSVRRPRVAPFFTVSH